MFRTLEDTSVTSTIRLAFQKKGGYPLSLPKTSGCSRVGYQVSYKPAKSIRPPARRWIQSGWRLDLGPVHS